MASIEGGEVMKITYKRFPIDDQQPKPDREIPKDYHEHPNGGGLVADTAHAADTAFVGVFAQMHGKSQMYNYATMCDNAQMRGNSQMLDKSQMNGNSEMCDNSRMYGYSQMHGKSRMHGKSQMHGNSEIGGSDWYRSPLYVDGLRWPINEWSNSEIRVGCRHMPASDMVAYLSDTDYSGSVCDNKERQRIIRAIHYIERERELYLEEKAKEADHIADASKKVEDMQSSFCCDECGCPIDRVLGHGFGHTWFCSDCCELAGSESKEVK